MKHGVMRILAVLALLAAAGSAGAVEIEAESGTMAGNVQLRVHDEASGGYRVMGFRYEGDSLLLEDVPAGTYLQITHSLNYSTSKQCSLYLNGTDVATVVFDPTGSWDLYGTTWLPHPGPGDLKLQMDADDVAVDLETEGSASIDKISITDTIPSPIVLKPWQHEKALFGYDPEFTLNVPNFDIHNQPYIRSRSPDLDGTSFTHTLQLGKWDLRDFRSDVAAGAPNYTSFYRDAGWNGARIVFDKDDDAYTPLGLRTSSGTKYVLLYSRDKCRTWQVYDLPYGTPAIENSASPEPLEGPPCVLTFQYYAPHPATYCNYNRMYLTVPEKTESGLDLSTSILITTNSFGAALHSGGASFMATRNGKTHFVWGEVAPDDAPGVPSYVATYDRATGAVSPWHFIDYNPPLNDVHNTPGICMDSEGYLHIVTGSHGETFWYTRSLAPESTQDGWTPTTWTLTTGWDDLVDPERGRQTYLGLLRDQDDTLHIAFRQWRRNVDGYHPGGYYGALSYQRKPKNGPWSDARPLVIPPLPNYCIWYHKLAVDRKGGLFLSYSHWNQTDGYNGTQYRYQYRALLTSPDGGDTWDLVDTPDLQARIDSIWPTGVGAHWALY